MPPLVAFAGTLGGLALVRWTYRTVRHIQDEIEKARVAVATEPVRPSELPTLKRDPETGAYRPG